MAPSKNYEFSGAIVPQWQVLYTLVHFSQSHVFPNVDSAGLAATRAALLARGIALPNGTFDALVNIFLRLSKPEKVALRATKAADVGPPQNVAFRADYDQMEVQIPEPNGSENTAHGSTGSEWNLDTELNKFFAGMTSSNPSMLQGTQLHHPQPNRPQFDLATALQGAGEFNFEQESPDSSSTDTTPLIPKQTDNASQTQTGFDFSEAELQMLGPDPLESAFFEYGATFSALPTPPPDQTSNQTTATHNDQPGVNVNDMDLGTSSPFTIDHFVATPPITINPPMLLLNHNNTSSSSYHSNTNVRSARPHQGESPLSPIPGHDANYEQAQARIDESVRFMRKGIDDAVEQLRAHSASSDQPRRSHESMYGSPKISCKDRLERGITRGVNKVREGLGKHHKVRRFLAEKSEKVREKVKAAHEAYTRRHSLRTFDGDLVEWKYEKLPGSDPDWLCSDGEWIAPPKPMTEEVQWTQYDREFPGM